MSSNYKVISITFHLDKAYCPYDIIYDLHHYFSRKCVASINGLSGDIIICTLYGENVVSKIRSLESIVIRDQLRKFKIVETNVIGICVKLDFWQIAEKDVYNTLRQYGSVLKNETFTESGVLEDDCSRYDHRFYYALIDLRRDLPTKLKVRQYVCEVSEIKA